MKKNSGIRWKSLALAMVMAFSIITVMPQDVDAAEVSLDAKGGTVTITDDECSSAGNLTWIRFKPKANGYLQLKFTGASQAVKSPYGVAQLYDRTKEKKLSAELEYDTGNANAGLMTEYYGVQKKKTYYIGVAAVGGVKIAAKFKKVTDKSGKSKKKALNIKKGKKGVVGVIAAGTKFSHWYKFKIPKQQKMSLNIVPYLTGNISVKISGCTRGGGIIKCRETVNNIINLNGWGAKCGYSSKGKKVNSGICYVQIKPTSKTCSGYYKISWK